MAIGAITRLYQRLGRRYPFTFLAIELQSALVIVAGTLALLTFYYEGSLADYLLILAITLALTEAAIIATLLRARPLLRPISDWIGGERGEEATERAWAAAVSIPLHLVKRDLPVPVVATAIPTCVAGVLILDLTGWSLFPLLAVAAVSIGYGMMLHYLAVEAGMRPVLVEINSCSRRAEVGRLLGPAAAHPAAGLAAADQPDHRAGRRRAHLRRRRRREPRPRRAGRAAGRDDDLARAHGDALEVDPAAASRDLERAVDALREGHYDVSVPVTTGDELGELAASFNQMVDGLAERERLREAFGTYLDEEVAEYILSEGFNEEGVEVEVSGPVLRRPRLHRVRRRARRRTRWSRRSTGSSR